MGFADILWLFFMISALQPILRQKMLEASRLRVLHRFERARKSRAIALVHRQETMSILGFPLMRYIDVNDSEEILRAIKLTDPDWPIDLIIHTPGGLVLAAGQIAHALKRHRAKVTVFVPHYAMSGGTLIALAADEIVMDPNAVLGPVDPQLGQSPAASVLTVLDRKKPEDIDDQTLILADVSRKAIAHQADGPGSPLGADVAGAGRVAGREADDRHLDARLWDHGGGGQVPRAAYQHGDATGRVRLHEPVPPADAHTAGRRVRAGTVPDASGPRVMQGPCEPATLAGTLDDLAGRGFTEHFVLRNGRLRGLDTGKNFAADQVVISEHYRFEGVSDPDDMAILYAIETRSGIRGTLTDAFGVYSDPLIAVFIEDVQDSHRFARSGTLKEQ